ncbi:Golgin sub A member 2 [Allomyces arbusculus]|nr:Golgin sub A member 2 [Allomyces arbusculus]
MLSSQKNDARVAAAAAATDDHDAISYHDDFDHDADTNLPSTTDHDHDDPLGLAALSRDLLEREQRYRARDAELAQSTKQALAATEAAVKESLARLESAPLVTPAPPSPPPRPLAVPTPPPASSLTTASARGRRISSAPSARKPGTAAGKPSGSARQATTQELALIEQIAATLAANAGIDDDTDYTLEATNRYLKARLLVVESELDKLHATSRSRSTTDPTATKLAQLESTHRKLTKDHANLQAAHTKLTAQAQRDAHRAESAEAQIVQLKRELAAKEKAAKATDVDARDAKLNRALEDADRLRAQLARAETDRRDQVDKVQRAHDRVVAELKRVEKQKSELMVGFKKQAALIDVLRKQKLHLEAVKLLSFTEDEFAKVLDWY